MTTLAVSTPSIEPLRVTVLQVGYPLPKAEYVLLWVQQDVRARCNHALEYAIMEANRLHLPVLACYGLCETFPGASERAFAFLLQGLQDLEAELRKRGIRLVCKKGRPPMVVQEFAQGAALVVTDCGYTRICRQWRQEIVEKLPGMRCVQVETNVVVPIGVASSIAEPAAATLRPKIHRWLKRFLQPVCESVVACPGPDIQLEDGLEKSLFNVQNADEALAALSVDRSVPRLALWYGGSAAGQKRLSDFIPRLSSYGTGKANDPSVQGNSFLSPYLHFGHLSPIDIALQVRASAQNTNAAIAAGTGRSGVEAFLEELIVRRELARNFCYFCSSYDSMECLPVWARASLEQHKHDPRPAQYSDIQLVRGETDDACWNAAQWEMVASGHMHNYMRMYWCKQILLWGSNPANALKLAMQLNDTYSLDGRDENGYMGIAWCFGLHDRPFPERPIFGEIRPMTRKGLEGKFNMQRYKDVVRRKCREALRAEPRLRELLPDAAFGGENGPSAGLTVIFMAQKQVRQESQQESGHEAEGAEKCKIADTYGESALKRSNEPLGCAAKKQRVIAATSCIKKAKAVEGKTLHLFFSSRAGSVG